MNVLVAHPSTELYGSDRQVLESVAGFLAVGWDVTVALPGTGPLTGRLGEVTVITAASPVLRKSQLSVRGLLTLLVSTPVVLWRLVRVIRRAAPDLVYVNTITLPFWLLAARLARRPVLVHVHEAEEMSAPALRRALYAPLVGAHCVVANSATTARVVAAACPRVRERIVTVPNGVADPGARPASQVVPGRLALVSRLSPRKGVDVALEALALLRAAGRDVSLAVCGSTFAGYEWFEAQLRDRAARPDLAGRVSFHGFLDSVLTPLAEAEVVLAPSFGESFGNAVVEGMLAGRPVVASDVQGLAEIVSDGVDGLLVPPGDAQALADAVATLLDDRERASALATQARDMATDRFSLERYRRDFVAAARRTASAPVASAGSSHARIGALVVLTTAIGLLLAGCTGSSSGSAAGTSGPGTGAVISGTAGSSGVGSSATGSSPAATRTPSVLRSPVPAPGSGNISQKVGPGRISTRPAVALTATAVAGGGVTVRLAAHTVITGKATRPGEISGPATRLTLRLTNGSSRAISLDNAVVNATDSRKVPLVALSGPPSAPFHGRLAAGSSTTATYVFTLAQGRHNPYTISVSYAPTAAVVQFVGDAA